jgi:TonB family protein
MRQNNKHWLKTLGLGLSCLLATSSVLSAITETRLVALAMHKETGRNIYIGAIHYDKRVPRPDDLLSAAGPKVMEYRVVARRTSIRSIMGSILLQGELATGTSPSDNTSNFAGDIMAAVKGSLYAGDSLAIVLRKNGNISATLDGVELARTDDREVADYLLMGWIGERGPSTAFRSSILSPELDSTMMSIYTAHPAPKKRLAVVSSWTAPPRKQLKPAPTATAAIATVSMDATLVATNTPTATPTQTEGAQGAPELDPALGGQFTGAVLVASLSPTLEMMQSSPVDNKTADMVDAIEYSLRLATFNTLVIRSVYAQIRYPRAAVRRNLQGTLELDLTLNNDGSLQGIAVARSSGHNMLDKSAINAAEKAFSKTPLEDIDQVAFAEYSENGSELIIPIPISFILTE